MVKKLIKNYPKIIVSFLFIFVIIIRWKVLYNFCFLFTDNDQLVLWDAAKDMSQGIFHEPCFYGQAYNPLFEPLFAQPLILAGISLRISLPLISGLFGLLPYILLGWGCYKREQYISAAFALGLLLWLPIEFHVITSIPRGYLPACCFAALGIYFVMFTDHKWRFFWFAFLSLIAIVTSQNSVLLVLPVAVYILLKHFKEPKLYTQSAVGFLTSLPLPLFIYLFYKTHPSYNFHELELNFDLDSFQQTLKNTDLYFNYLSPSPSHKLLLILSFFGFFILLCFFKRNIKAGLSIIAALFFFLFTLSFDKSQDGTANMFYSSVRIFLGVPIAFIIFCAWGEAPNYSIEIQNNLKFVLLIMLLIIGSIYFYRDSEKLNVIVNNESRKTEIIVSDKVSHSRQLCDQIANLCRSNKSNLVILDSTMADVNYMCPVLNYSFITMIPDYERRTWIMQKEDTVIRKDFIYLSQDSLKMQKHLTGVVSFKKINEEPPAYLVETLGKNVFKILNDMHIDVRPH